MDIQTASRLAKETKSMTDKELNLNTESLAGSELREHRPGGWSCGDTTDADGNCVVMVDYESAYGTTLGPANCTCQCHEES